MKARMYKAGAAAAVVAAGVGIFGITTTATAAAALPTDPTVAKLSTNKGSTAGGTIVTITGKNFGSGTPTVKFTDRAGTPVVTTVAAASVMVQSDTALVVKAPALGAGINDVSVTIGAAVSVNSAADDFTYIVPVDAAVAASTLLNPLGKTTVVASATTYADETAFKAAKLTATVNGVAAPVTFGGPSTGTAPNKTKVLITAPAGTPSATAASVKLYTNGVAGAADATNAKYVAVISSLSKTSGTPAGGDVITVKGKGLTGATLWKFGGVAAPTCAQASAAKTDTEWTCTVPAGAAGPVSVNFTPGAGTLGTTVGATYTYSNLG